MKLATFKAIAAAVSVVAAVGSGAAFAQEKGKAPAKAAAGPMEQFFPALVYRTGAYAPNGVPFANGYGDYLKLVNAREGGLNGVKITYEECETGYATDRGVGVKSSHRFETEPVALQDAQVFDDEVELSHAVFCQSVGAQALEFIGK